MLPTQLIDELRKAGLTVVVVSGWQNRGRPGQFRPVGVLNHHTGASAKSWNRARRTEYARWMFITGRPDLPAPLCQIGLGPDGEVYVGAAGRANHAGRAKPSGSVAGGDGNSLYVGIEWMLSGTEAIPAIMRRNGAVLNAVLLKHVTKTSPMAVSSHYQTSLTGKWDIGDPNGINYKGARVLDVSAFRREVSAEMAILNRTNKPKSQVRPTIRAVRQDLIKNRSQLKRVVERLAPSKDPVLIEARRDAQRLFNETGELLARMPKK